MIRKLLLAWCCLATIAMSVGIVLGAQPEEIPRESPLWSDAIIEIVKEQLQVDAKSLPSSNPAGVRDKSTRAK